MKAFLALLLATTSVLAVNPGLKATGTQKFVSYATSVGVELLNANIANIDIPPVSGEPLEKVYVKDPSVPIPSRFLTVAAYQLYDIKIVNFKAGSDKALVSLQPPASVMGKVEGVATGVFLKYKVWVGWCDDKNSILCFEHDGSATATISYASFSVDAGVDSVQGRPHINIKGCIGDIGDLNIKLDGNVVEDILNLLSGLVSDLLKAQVPPTVCGQIKTIVEDTANSLLSQIDMSSALGQGFNVDWGMTSSPKVDAANVFVDLLGRVWFDGHHDDAAIPTAGPIAPIDDEASKMVCFKLDAGEVLGSAFYAAIVGKWLERKVTPALLAQFNISADLLQCDCGGAQCIGTFIPEIQSKCSGSGVVSMELAVSGMPTISVSPAGASIGLTGTIGMSGVVNGVTTPLLTASATMDAFIGNTLQFNGWKLTGSVEIKGATLKLKSSNVGKVDEESLEQLWQIALLALVNGELNKLTQRGITLPSIPFLDVLSPELKFGQHSLSICSDVKYTGPIHIQ